MVCEGFPLFAAADESRIRSLLASELGSLAPDERVADLFCGAGGWGEGAGELGIRVDFAVNHNEVAIGTHEVNNPWCKHHKGDAWRTRPRDVVGGSKIGLLMASAACTTHSRARGSAPISKRVHMLGWCIARWMEDVSPRIVLIENVPEWKDWGPTVLRDGVRVQDPSRKGMHFRRWWRYCEKLGYRMEMNVLDAPDYGAASRRKRLFIIARRDEAPIAWPAKTHGPKSEKAGKKLTPFRSAAECIDWSDLGTSIFERKRPLKDKTLRRIAEGIRRYVLNDPRPFVLRVTHGESGGWKVSEADATMPTQTTRQDLAVATPVLHVIRHDAAGRDVRESMPTITAGNGPGRGAGAAHALGIATPILATTGYGERIGQAPRVNQIAELLGTSVDGVKQALVTPIIGVCAHGESSNGSKRWGRGALPVTGPVNAIHAGGNNFAVVSPVMVHNTTGHTGGPVDGVVPTVTTGGQTGVAVPVMAYLNHGGKQVAAIEDPLRTVVSGGGHAMLVAALMMEYYGNAKSCSRPDGSLGAVTTLDRHGLVCCVIDGQEMVIVDILFRMLKPAELAKAMGFRLDYQWPKTARDTVRLIGNAVSPVQAKALVAAVLPGGRKRTRAAAS